MKNPGPNGSGRGGQIPLWARKIRVFPISFLFARAFPGIRMRKLRGLGLPLGLLSGKPFQFGRNDNRRGLS